MLFHFWLWIGICGKLEAVFLSLISKVMNGSVCWTAENSGLPPKTDFLVLHRPIFDKERAVLFDELHESIILPIRELPEWGSSKQISPAAPGPSYAIQPRAIP